MNPVRGAQGGDRRQPARPVLSAYLIVVRLLIGGGCRLQAAPRTRLLGRPKLPRGRAALAAAVGFLTVALAGPAVSTPAHPATPVAAPAAGQTASLRAAQAATECNGLAKNKEEAKGCFNTDPRLGPEQLPTTGPEGSVTGEVAKMTAGYQRFGDEQTKEKLFQDYWDGSPDPFPPNCGKPSLSCGKWKYPGNGGFAPLPNGKPNHYPQMLMPGALVDRFGPGSGTYLAPATTPYAKRAIPPSNLDTYYPSPPSTPTYHYNYHLYRVLKNFLVDAGPIAPWFGQKGRGLQYITCFSSDFTNPCASPNVDELVKKRSPVLEEVALSGD